MRARDRNVFLNVPFDTEYRALFLALIAGLAGLGLRPRCSLEVPPQRDRLRRIHDLLAVCRYSIHDLSRVEVGAERQLPRFNMPFELGLAVGLAFARRGHDWVIFESRPYRVQVSLSDLNGFDPYIHYGTPRGLLARLRDVFTAQSESVSLAMLERLDARLNLFSERLPDDGNPFSPAPFRELVVAASDFARSLTAS